MNCSSLENQAPCSSKTSSSSGTQSSSQSETPRRSSISCADGGVSSHQTDEDRSRSGSRSNDGTCRRDQMRSRSLSYSELAATSCTFFAPLPEYAQYQERKTQRALSRRCIFTENTSSASCGLESRQGKIVVSRDFVDVMTRQPPSPTRTNYDEDQPRRQPLVATSSNQVNTQAGRSGPKDEHAMCVEVSPGVTTLLRRVDETMLAIRNDFFIPVTCLSCSLDLFCIADAEFVLCPKCRVVSPVENGSELFKGQREGLGLGLSYDNLVKIQSEIASSSSTPSLPSVPSL